MKKEANYEIIPRKQRYGRPTKRPPLEQLKQDYMEMTTREMAKKYQVSDSTVRNWVYKARRGYFVESKGM